MTSNTNEFLLDRIEYLEAQVNRTCKWKRLNEYDYQLGCGDTYSMETPVYKYCMDCGGKVEVE
jgi:hypothetical protein